MTNPVERAARPLYLFVFTQCAASNAFRTLLELRYIPTSAR